MDYYLPSLVAHADWSKSPKKRWMATARLREDGKYIFYSLEPVGKLDNLLQRLAKLSDHNGSILIGFDFPIGLPEIYARSAGITNFPSLLPRLGGPQWPEFYNTAVFPEQISIKRPFYPYRPGGTKQSHLIKALGVKSINALLRRCEKPLHNLPAAAPLFWTMGAKQVGKAAITGWREVLSPALNQKKVEIWPFHGTLSTLLKPGCFVIAETYPALYYRHLQFNVRKTDPLSRISVGLNLVSWARMQNIILDSSLKEKINNGFGSDPDGEDPFDATVGLFGMLNVILGNQEEGVPDDPTIKTIEGWILGRTK